LSRRLRGCETGGRPGGPRSGDLRRAFDTVHARRARPPVGREHGGGQHQAPGRERSARRQGRCCRSQGQGNRPRPRDGRMSDDRTRSTAGGIGAALGDVARTIDPQAGGLGSSLKNARVARGLELADIAELTHVRREYLRGLEEGRYADLPEDVYTRNFVRLFAQAVELDPESAMLAYQSERKQAGGLSTLEMRLEKERKGEPPPKRKRS